MTGTQIAYYFICHRKLWLFSHQVQMEQESERVTLGRLNHEFSYPERAAKYKEIEIGGIKLDAFDEKRRIVREIKLTDKMEEAHVWQLKYYISVLKANGFGQVTGLLEYPKMRKTEEVLLTQEDENRLLAIAGEVEWIIAGNCPDRLKKSFCRKCAYFEFCWSEEDEDSPE